MIRAVPFEPAELSPGIQGYLDFRGRAPFGFRTVAAAPHYRALVLD